MAGVSLALNCNALSIVLTDGNEKCVRNINDIITMNKPNLLCADISSSVVRWDDESTFKQYKFQFDFLLAADCMFFEETHHELVNAISYLLVSGGRALLFAPYRGNTLNAFVALCQTEFSNVTVSEPSQYSKTVESYHKTALSNNPLYKENIHKPILIQLEK